jgi:hypothetical protein
VTEPTNILAAGLAAVYVLVSRIDRRQIGGAAAISALLLVSGASTVAGTVIVHRMIARDVPAIELPRNRDFKVESLPRSQVADHLAALVTPIGRPHLPTFLDRAAIRAGVILVGFLLLVGVIETSMHDPDRRARCLGIAVALVMVVAGPAIVTFNFVISGEYFPLPERYGLPLLPALAAVTGRLLRRHPMAVRGAEGLAVLAGGGLFLALVGAL